MNDILKQIAKTDIAGIVFAEILDSLATDNDELTEVMAKVAAVLPKALLMELEETISAHSAQALELGFRAGWNMRSKA